MSSLSSTFLQENWAWVDHRLEELYHGYGRTADNYEDYVDAGLLEERWAWVDDELQTHYSGEFNDRIPCPAPLHWVLYKESPKQYCLEEETMEEEELSSRSRAESDISDHSAEVEQALKCLHEGMYPINNSYLFAIADEKASLNSTDMDDECSTFTCYSDADTMIFEIEDGYDSF